MTEPPKMPGPEPDAARRARRDGRGGRDRRGDWPGPTRGLERLAALSVAHPRTVLAVAAVLAALSIAWAASHLALRTSNLDLVDPELPPVAAFRDLARSFGTPNSLVVVLEGSDPAALRRTVDRLTPLLAAVDGTRSVFGRLPGDPGLLLRMGIDPYLTSRRPGPDAEPADRSELAFLFVQPSDAESRAETIAPWVEGVRRVLERQGLRGGPHSESGLDGDLDSDPGSDPANPSGIRAGLTGLPQYAIDDRDAVRHDLTVLSPVSFVLVLLLFVGAFAALRRPLAVMVALLAGVAVTLGLAAVWPGHLTLLSAFFGSVLFGLGVDFGIHVVDRTEEILFEGRAESGGADGEAGGRSDQIATEEGTAVVAAIASLAPALTTGAATTASAFAVMAFSGFRGFAELGAIAGAGVPICLLAMVTVLPALLALWPAASATPRRRRPGRSPDRRLGRWLLRLQSPALAIALAAAALGGPLLVRPGFDTDYLNLEPAGSEAVHWEREMVHRSPYSPQFAAFVADSRQQADALAERLARDPTVGEVHSVADLDRLAALGARADSPEMRSLGQRFVGSDGRYAVYAYPKEDIWREPAGTRFLAHMQAIDPGVTGLPVLGRFMIARSHRALAVTGVLAGLAILAWTLVDLRDPLLAVLAVLPTLLGAGAMLALMGALGVDFNPLDVMALPLVLGIAVDDGVHLVHRFLAEGGDLAATLRGTGRSVVLTSLTSLAAFGVLAFASHRGLASFGAAAGLGVAASLVLSVLVLPQALLALSRVRR
jgi:predicted RND superfamily exporter protein